MAGSRENPGHGNLGIPGILGIPGEIIAGHRTRV